MVNPAITVLDTTENRTETALVYTVPNGTIGVLVSHNGRGTANISVIDKEAALWARGHTDEEFTVSAAAKAARNRYGFGTMRSIFRDVEARFRGIHTWIVDPKTRAKTGQPRVWVTGRST